jgi:hypothetical protein
MPTLTCECCERDTEVSDPKIGDRVTCSSCGATMRVASITTNLTAELVRAPDGFDDAEVTPLEVPVPLSNRRQEPSP